MRTLFPIVTPLIVTALSAHALQDQQPISPFRSGVSYVLVDVYPRKDGRLIEGLTASDFELLEDGKRQVVEAFMFHHAPALEPDPTRRDPTSVRESLTEAADPANRLFVLFLDRLHVSDEGARASRKPTLALLNSILAPNDLFATVFPEMPPGDLTFRRRLRPLEETLEKDWQWGARHDRSHRDRVEGELRSCYSGEYAWDGDLYRRVSEILIDRRREEQVITALEDLTEYLGTLRQTRSIVIVLTEGWVAFRPDDSLAELPTGPIDALGVVGERGRGIRIRPPTGSAAPTTETCVSERVRLAAMDGQDRLRDLTGRAERLNVSFYTVHPVGLATILHETPFADPGAPAQFRNAGSMLQALQRRVLAREHNIKTVAEATGGSAVVTNEIEKGIGRITDELGAFYVLGYRSTNPRTDGKYRRIEVKVNRPGVRVSARRGYFAARQ
jgi:VWFA-related protein